MATLFRRHGSSFYWTAFFGADGRRRYCSKKQKTRSEAMAVAAEMERRARRLTVDDDDRRREILRILDDAGQHGVRGTLTVPMAQEFLKKLTETATGQRLQATGIEAWLRTWLGEKKVSRSGGTFERYEGVVEGFIGSLSEAKRRAGLGTLTTADLSAFRDRLLKEGRAPATANMAVKIIRSALTVARKQGLILTNPAEALEMVTVVVKEKGTFTPQQVAKLLRVAQGDWYGLILLGYYTGSRISDLSNLRWSAVDLTRRSVYFRQQKTKRVIEIPLHDEVLAWLEPRRKNRDTAAPDAFVFPTLAGKATGARNGLSGQFSLIMEKAGINPGLSGKHGAKGRNRSKLSFHSLRHSFNSAMANAGVPQELRQRLTGHASKAVNDRYTHTQLETLREAVAKVPGVS